MSSPEWGADMRRREFLGVVGGAAALWPVVAHAQQPERKRRVGVLLGGTASGDPESESRIDAFRQGLQQLGWTDRRNVLIDYRRGLGDANSIRKYAAELIALAPDVIFAAGTATMAPLLQATRTVP